MIRIHCGLEGEDLLIADLEKGLERIGAGIRRKEES